MGIGIQFPEFFFCIASPVSAEIRETGNFVGVFCIEKQLVHTSPCQHMNEPFYRRDRSRSISGTVQHKTVFGKVWRFFYMKIFLQMVQNHIEGFEEMSWLPAGNSAGIAFFYTGQVFLVTDKVYSNFKLRGSVQGIVLQEKVGCLSDIVQVQSVRVCSVSK